VLFVCENNFYMEYTPIRSVTAVANPAADRAAANGLPSQVIDGNDVVVVHDSVAAAAERARAGEGPTVIEAHTYRHYGHSRADPATYRPAEELERWLQRDPLDVARARLGELGVPDADIAAADERAAQVVARALSDAKAAPPADPAEALTDVWADGGAAWRN
jgi:acetoin:2,6-dichlorophenolindophenol oxidoreductase subunit alpha